MISFKQFPVKNTTLTNIEVEDYAKKLKIKNFTGCKMRDQVTGKPEMNECCIVNTDVSSGKGFHYVCYFKKSKFKCSFDSFGLKPLIEIQKYLGKGILYSTYRLQKVTDSNCR